MPETEPTPRYAAIIAGPRWWGDRRSDRDGTPTLKENLKRREAEARREDEIMTDIVGRLPAKCFIIQGGARGADTLAAQKCRARGMNCAGVPYFSNEGKRGGFLRNEMMGLLLNGLALQGFTVKAVVVAPPEPEPVTGGTQMMVDLAEGLGIRVQTVRYEEPAEETPETDEPTTEESTDAHDS